VQLQSLIVITTRRLVDLQVDVVEKIMQDQGTEFLAVKLALSYGFLWKLWAVQLQSEALGRTVLCLEYICNNSHTFTAYGCIENCNME